MPHLRVRGGSNCCFTRTCTFFGSNFCVFGPIDLIFALFDGIYLQFDDPDEILEKNRKFQKLEPKKHQILWNLRFWEFEIFFQNFTRQKKNNFGKRGVSRQRWVVWAWEYQKTKRQGQENKILGLLAPVLTYMRSYRPLHCSGNPQEKNLEKNTPWSAKTVVWAPPTPRGRGGGPAGRADRPKFSPHISYPISVRNHVPDVERLYLPEF